MGCEAREHASSERRLIRCRRWSGWDLGPGETAVLSWARRHAGFEALIDDRAARTCAAALGIPARGTLGVLLLAKKEGLVDRVGPVVDEVIAAGLRVDNRLREAVLRLAGESP